MKKPKTIEHINTQIEGITCSACVARIEKALANIKGLSNVSVNFATEKASFDVDTSIVHFDEIAEQIRKLSEVKIVFYKLSMTVRHKINKYPPYETSRFY